MSKHFGERTVKKYACDLSDLKRLEGAGGHPASNIKFQTLTGPIFVDLFSSYV